MADSIRKLSTDAVMALLAGNSEKPMPAGLGTVVINKNRRLPIGPSEIPMFSVYFVNNVPKPIGNPRRPVINQHHMTIEVRVITQGNDDVADPYCQWVIAQLGAAEQLSDANGSQLTMSVSEAETIFEALEGSEGKITLTTMRWVIEYKTLPADITRTS